MEVAFTRKAEKITTNTKEREALKARDLLKRYAKPKADKLMKSLRERGLWYWDPEFPQDEEELWVLG